MERQRIEKSGSQDCRSVADAPAETARSIRMPAAERRSLLVQHAVDTFAKKGFHATSMEDVAIAAGVTKPVIYQHFTSKRQLYIAILRHVGEEMKEAIGGKTDELVDQKTRLYRGVDAYCKYAYENHSAYELLFGSGGRRDPEFREVVAEIEQEMADMVTSTIDVDLEEEHRSMAAVAIMGMSEATMRQYLTNYPPSKLSAGSSYQGSTAQLWSKRLADLAWAGMRAIHRD